MGLIRGAYESFPQACGKLLKVFHRFSIICGKLFTSPFYIISIKLNSFLLLRSTAEILNLNAVCVLYNLLVKFIEVLIEIVFA